MDGPDDELAVTADESVSAVETAIEFGTGA